jgi:glycerol kinase
VESTVLGAALLAGLKSGVFASTDVIAELWSSDRVFEPQMSAEKRDALYHGWQEAVSRVRVS